MMAIPAAPNMEEQFPRIFKSVRTMWGSPECREYLMNLGVQEGGADRQGFPFEILTEINHIVDAHDDQFPLHKPLDLPFTGVYSY